MLDGLLRKRVLMLDGALGTLVQRQSLGEADYRGERFARHPCNLHGNHDLLTLTRPDVITDIHERYLAAGSDVIRTNTFTGSAAGQAAYGLADLAGELNAAAARLAAGAARRWTARTPDRPRLVAGTMGPIQKARGAKREAGGERREALADLYDEQVRGLRDGGCDLFLVETICDIRQAEAALEAIARAGADDRPVALSVTVTEHDARLPSGDTLDAFIAAVMRAQPAIFALGLNCAFGARRIRPALAELAARSPVWVSCHPSAGLPAPDGTYPESPETTAAIARALARDGLLNLVGGCCGTTPAHVDAVAAAVAGVAPRRPGAPRRS
jgi:5-methyltetrahydrofolate--homocysteine methyltransferase